MIFFLILKAKMILSLQTLLKKLIQHSQLPQYKPLFIFTFLAIGVYFGTLINTEKKDKFSEIIDIIQNDYVDTTVGELIREEAIIHLLAQLDPHSSYIPPQLTAINESQISGNYDGIGVEYILYKDTVFIYKVHPQSPAMKVGIKEGDRILKANEFVLNDSNAQDNFKKSFEKEIVNLTILRRKTNKTLSFNIKKGPITINSSSVFYMVNSTLGYIKLERFSANTHSEFINSLKNLQSKGMKELIIDLRDNGGGLLSEAVAIANEFLPKNALITYTEGNKRSKKEYVADGNGLFLNGKLILLTNQNTASASEILAGAFQDNDRAVIMGNRTFGKGLVQEPFRLRDGSALRLTTARYYTPSGRSLQKNYSKNIEWYKAEIFRRDIFQDTINPVFDSSQIKDFFSINGRLLTVGQGIRPDVFFKEILFDSLLNQRMITFLNHSKLFDVYILDYYQNELQNIKKTFPKMSDFNSKFEVSQRMTDQIFKMIRLNYGQLYSGKNSVYLIQKNLKAAIADRIYGENGKSLFLNTSEGVFSKSFEVLKNYNDLLNIGSKKSRRFDY